MINETRERFIRDIAEHVDPSRIVELHFFPSIRQGPIETGVAVIAATPLPSELMGGAGPDAAAEPLPDPELALEVDASEADDESAYAEPPARAEVFTALYVLTRKGPDRGKWVVEVKAEAQAPMTTVEPVVRGVQDRAGEALDAHRMTGTEFREVLGIGSEAAADSAIETAVAEEAHEVAGAVANEIAPA